MISKPHKKSMSAKKGFSTGTKIGLIIVVVLMLGAFTLRFTTLGSTVANITLGTQSATEDGLILHWTMDATDFDSSQTSAEVRDRSGNGNHGNLIGN